MSYKTSVGFCIKPGIEVPKFEETEDCFDEIVKDERGTLYIADCVRWYPEVDVVKQVTEFLGVLNPENYYFVELDTNQDNPSVETKGTWFQNDFGLGTSCSVTWG